MNYSEDDHTGQAKLKLSYKDRPDFPGWIDHYKLIVIDPPWQYNLRESDRSHRGRCPYPAMTDQEILSLPIETIAAKDAYLILWVTNNHLPLGFKCLESWGFTYKTMHTWVKVSKKGSPHIGIGHYGRNCTEHYLIGVRGKPGTFTSLGLTSIPNVIQAQKSHHSKKPDEFWTVINQLAQTLNGPTIELFAREKRPGWDAWGLEV